MFSQDQLETEVKKQLNDGVINLPDDHKVALITHGDTETGAVSEILVWKPNKEWQVAGSGGYAKGQGFNAGFNVMWSK